MRPAKDVAMLNPEPSPCESQEFFHDHPGYSAIMEYLPKVFVAICDGPYCANTNPHPFNAPEMALKNLLALYDNLLLWERDQKTLSSKDASYICSINPAEDFPLAVELLITHLHTADPRKVDYNAHYIGGLIEIYKSTKKHAAEDTLTRVANYGYW